MQNMAFKQKRMIPLMLATILSINLFSAPAMAVPKLFDTSTDFSLKLFKKELKGKENKNVLVSPLSVYMALSMTASGARGKTKKAMLSTLGIVSDDLDSVGARNLEMLDRLRNSGSKGGVRLDIANALFARKGFDFSKQFLKSNREFYNAKIQALDFGDSNSVKEINSWVSENTQGKIPKIIEKISADHVLFLINAVYFKGDWSKPFEKSKTKEEAFHLADGKTQPVFMMHTLRKVPYLKGENFQAIGLAYGDKKTSAYIFLPDKNTDLKKFADSISDKNWKLWLGSMQHRKGNIALPRFKMNYSKKLKESLSDLGMKIAFDAQKANFKGMLPENSREQLFINQVLHKTFMEVNEEGTVAAAVTSVGMFRAMARVEDPPFNMVVDRPFIIALVDRETSAILFIGAVFKPER